MTNKAESDEQCTQLVGGAIELRFTIGKGLVHLQKALSAMSLIDDIEVVEHVKDNPPPDFLCLRILLGDSSIDWASSILKCLT
jgi:hypothetical protein